MFFQQLNNSFCKTYLIMNGKDKRAILIDPVRSIAEDYLHLLKDKGWTLTHVIDTHTHADHISAGPLLKETVGCGYIMHETAPAACVTIRVKDGEVLLLNDLKFRFIHAPGHTSDSMIILLEDRILTGDTLFLDEGGAGRDDLPGGDSEAHWKSMEMLKKLPDELMVYPAHDYADRQPSTLGRQKQSNPHLRNNNLGEFVEYIENLRLGPEDWMKDVLKANYACTKDPLAAFIPEDNMACAISGLAGQEAHDPEIRYIESGELEKSLKDPGTEVILLDVREEKELTEELGHIDGILHLPIGELNSRLDELEQFRDKLVVVICRSGARASVGARILMQAGFRRVRVLKGGMLAWRSGKS